MPAKRGTISIEITPRNVKLPPPPDPLGTEIETWANTFIVNRLMQMVIGEQAFLESGREILAQERTRLKQIEDHQDRTIKYHRKMTFYLSNYFLLVMIIVISLGTGLGIGINVPEGVICKSDQSPCWWMRIRLKRSL